MAVLVPLQPVPSQTLTVNLGNQVCRINVFQKLLGLYVDLYVNDALIIGGVIAHNRNRIVRSIYLGFIGDLAFLDNELEEDPTYSGLGSRFVLMYFSPSELPS